MLDLLQFMQHDGFLSANELVALRKTSKELGENPVRLMRSLNIASPEQIQFFLQKHFKVLLLKENALAELSADHQHFIPIDIALFYSCFGIGEENNILYVALEDPSDRGLINQLRFLLNKRIIGVCATVFQLAEGLSKIYNLSIANLKLTTSIEKSRGVVGGVRYEKKTEPEQQSESMENLLSFDFNSLPNHTEKIESFEDNIPIEKIDPLEKNTDQTEATGFDDIELQTEEINSEIKETFEINSELKEKIGLTINRALTKFSLLNTKEEAIELLNSLLEPYQISMKLDFEDPQTFTLKWDSKEFHSTWNQIEVEQNPIVLLLKPLIKKISKLK